MSHDDDYIDHTPEPPVIPVRKKHAKTPWRAYQELRPGTILMVQTEAVGQLELFPAVSGWSSTSQDLAGRRKR
jgi:hypothetical protein